MSPEDKALLVLAAKARGDEFDGTELKSQPGKPWDPFTDKGSALRMAAELSIDTYFTEGNPGSWRCIQGDGTKSGEAIESGAGQSFNGMCRAMIRAASEIGKKAPAKATKRSLA